jgi:DNA-binding MarR family transcriptional regulator
MTRPRERTRELSAYFHAVREKLQSVDKGNSASRDRLNMKEANVLMDIGTRGAMTMSGIADALQMTLSGVTTIVDKLEAMKFVRRTRSAQDRRVVNVELTPLGRKCFGEFEKNHLKVTDTILQILDDTEQEQLLHLFRKIADRLK